ncbi:transposase [Chryseobacterium sp. RP-3-3]|uniref:Transposase n=1 Tax=Chryseobacterium antibioticum TaxID=2728847 RepID=A0A7Y0FTE0_9FLAO|nr:transposase [Chryseobacterium antibioticum]NML72193.1 transposase [Chryseobacterium antibioticum]
MIDFKDIHIGRLVEIKWRESEISIERTCDFLKCTEEEVHILFLEKSIASDILLRWSKLLEYDFFRIYSQHLILFSPPASIDYNDRKNKIKSELPEFRKNIYTQEIINFLMELLDSGEKTKAQIIEDYKIPKTTLYKWISKYKKYE